MNALFSALLGVPSARPAARRRNRRGLAMEPLEGRAATSGGLNGVVYEVTVVNNATRAATVRKIAKKNTLALRNLPPGNYSVSYNIPGHRGHRILARNQPAVRGELTVNIPGDD